MKLDFLVVYATNLEQTVRFYQEQFGLAPTRERHGDGPEHYSFILDNVVLEVYPGKRKLLMGVSGGAKKKLSDPDGRTLIVDEPSVRSGE